MFLQMSVCQQGGRAWQRRACGGHAWQGGMHGGGMHGKGDMCGKGAVHGGSCVAGTHAWQILRDTVNERAVRILLECNLVDKVAVPCVLLTIILAKT